MLGKFIARYLGKFAPAFERLLARMEAKKCPAPRSRTRLGCEGLDDRIVPTVSGSVFYDLNGNGTWDTGEAPASGVWMALYDDGMWADDTSTDSSGNYSFNPGGSGPFSVALYMMSGYTVSTPVDGSGLSDPANPVGLVGTGNLPADSTPSTAGRGWTTTRTG